MFYNETEFVSGASMKSVSPLGFHLHNYKEHTYMIHENELFQFSGENEMQRILSFNGNVKPILFSENFMFILVDRQLKLYDIVSKSIQTMSSTVPPVIIVGEQIYMGG